MNKRIISRIDVAWLPHMFADSAKAALACGLLVEYREVRYTPMLFVWDVNESIANARHFYPLTNFNQAIELMRLGKVLYTVGHGMIGVSCDQARLVEHVKDDQNSQYFINRSCAMVVAILAGKYDAHECRNSPGILQRAGSTQAQHTHQD